MTEALSMETDMKMNDAEMVTHLSNIVIELSTSEAKLKQDTDNLTDHILRLQKEVHELKLDIRTLEHQLHGAETEATAWRERATELERKIEGMWPKGQMNNETL